MAIPDIEECSREHEITHATAEKLRQMLGDIQRESMRSIADTVIAFDMVEYISTRGFRLVDDLEGVIR
jgi:hypothetical protein